MNKHTLPLNIINIDVNEINEIRDRISIPKIRNRDIDGIVVKNFLSDVEVASLNKKLASLSDLNLNILTESTTYPASYATLNSSNPNYEADLKEYFRKCNQFSLTFKDVYEVDLEKKLSDFFGSLTEGGEALVPEARLGNYVPFTFRIVLPLKCHINIHCGNQFLHQFKSFYSDLTQKVDVWNQMSYFILLNEPEEGGALEVYNITYDEAKECNIERQSIIDESGNEFRAENSEELFCYKTDMKKGDLILFSAGQLWHKVGEVYGKEKRITIGGFMGFSKENNDVYFWS